MSGSTSDNMVRSMVTERMLQEHIKQCDARHAELSVKINSLTNNMADLTMAAKAARVGAEYNSWLLKVILAVLGGGGALTVPALYPQYAALLLR